MERDSGLGVLCPQPRHAYHVSITHGLWTIMNHYQMNMRNETVDAIWNI